MIYETNFFKKTEGYSNVNVIYYILRIVFNLVFASLRKE